MKLSELKINESARITSVKGVRETRRHLLDMGLTPGAVLTLIKKAPLGDPLEFYIRGYELTLRKEDADLIDIEMAKAEVVKRSAQKPQIDHPHLGERGEHKANEKPKISENIPITFALAGNQNSGKTTLFNKLTGSNQRVGNFPGVTVDKKEGQIKGENASLVDLPGIYSLSPFTNEEIVTRDFLLKGNADGIINIVDATNIERNLYLSMQLIELKVPMVIALNMMDEVRENGGSIDVNRLEEALGVPVIPISASKGEGLDELLSHAVHVARFKESPETIDFCKKDGDVKESAMHRTIHSIMHLIEDHAASSNIPLRFAATKLVEDDDLIKAQLNLDENEKETLEHILKQLETEAGEDREALLADIRFSFIESVCSSVVIKSGESKARERSIKADKILTGKYTALPAFIVIMALIFYITFGPFGTMLSDALSAVIDKITLAADSALSAFGLNSVVKSLIVDGIFVGVGSVLSFLPIIVVLFFFLSILEDTGYMARISFVMDKALRKIGLSGRSFVPLLIGFGCSVPAIMATRTLSSERDRKMTILLTPFASCSAKLPIYALFTAAFFANHRGLVMVSLYLIGIIVGLVFSLILNKTGFKGSPVPFVLELPNYRFPTAKNVLLLIWQKTKDFITKAFTIIFFASIVIWFLQSFDLRLNVVSDSSMSILALLGSFISPIFAPLGLNDWRISTALVTGFTAKENVISTMLVLFGSADALRSVFSPLSAFTFLIFTLLYTPCVAAIATVKKELGRRYAVTVILAQCLIAYFVALIFRLVGLLVL